MGSQGQQGGQLQEGEKGKAAHGSEQRGGDGDKKKAKEKYWWFGYKVHLLVDTKYEVPIAAAVTTAKTADTTQLKPLLAKRDELLPASQS